MGNGSVRDWMHWGVITCRSDATIQEVVEAVSAHGISALVVVEETGDAIGVISKTDLASIRVVEPHLGNWRGLTVGHLMSSPAISVSEETPLTEAVALLLAKKIHRLIVTEQQGTHRRPIGILSVADLIKGM